jgi:hypothetical protein
LRTERFQAIRQKKIFKISHLGKGKIKMKTTIKLTLAMLALGLSTLALSAQDNNGGPPDGGPPDGGPPPDGQGRHHRPPPLPLLLALDVNHDGIIDSNEIANASAELLTLDKNHDGQLTPDEYLPPRPQNLNTNDMGRAFRPPRSPLVEALDVNHDGIIDSNEIANASAELLTLDKNHDGQLTPDEYRPHRPHGMGGPPGDRDSNNDGPPGPPSGDDNSSNGGPPGPPPDGGDSNGGPPGPPPSQ